MRIGFDIDGVLADFNSSYIQVLNSINNKWADVTYQPTQWSYEEELGFSSDDVSKAWDFVKDGKNEFWYKLHPLKDVPFDLNKIDDENNDIYFITSRPGQWAKWQSEKWLMDELGMYDPTVLISSHKGLCAQALDLEVYIDDRLENIEDVQRTSPGTRAYLINRPYNGARDVLRRADTVSDVLIREGLSD